MVKRQASQLLPSRIKWSIILPLFVIILLFLSGCQPSEINQPTQTPEVIFTETPVKNPATVTPSPTIHSEKTATLVPSPTKTMDCLITGGQIQNASFTSQILGRTLSYQVYLPPCYFSSPEYDGYPVIYLLHGLLADNDQWIRIGLVQSMDTLIADGTIPPTIIVLPQEPSMAPPQTSQFDKMIVQELIPWIDSVYQTRADKSYRAIGGVSRGAGWAVRIGLENINLFSKVGAHSLPLFEADGGKVLTWLMQTPKEDIPEVFIDIGRDDQEWQTAQVFADQLDEHNIPHEWYLFTGGHTEVYWSSHLEQYLRWYTRDW